MAPSAPYTATLDLLLLAVTLQRWLRDMRFWRGSPISSVLLGPRGGCTAYATLLCRLPLRASFTGLPIPRAWGRPPVLIQSIVMASDTTELCNMLRAVSSVTGSRYNQESRVVPYVRAMSATDSTTSPDSIYRFNVRDANGQEVPMSIFNDKKVLLIVNVASQCGFTPQYRELQTLQEKYGDKGFSVVAFPCNQFGGQEPGTVSEVCSFAKDRFKVSFPIMDKVEVNGKNADPLWQYLKEKQPGFITNAIKWNFSKFMVKDGIPTKRYSPHESPASIEPDIDAALSTDVNA